MKNQPKHKSVPKVFIIESLGANDVNNHRCDGKILEAQLQLIGEESVYRYVLNVSDLRNALCEFDESEFRFLHVSCHGDSAKAYLAANPAGETYEEFSKCFSSKVALTRVTFAACKLGNKSFFEEFCRWNKGVQSLAAPMNDLPFQRSSLYWATYYTKLIEECRNSNNHIHRDFIESVVPQLSKVLNVSMRYAIYEPNKDRIKVQMTKRGRPSFVSPWSS